MRILFLHSGQEDYVNLGLLHGFRQLNHIEFVDVPKYEPAYFSAQADFKKKFRGYGFSIYGMLPDLPELEEERKHWRLRIALYDVIIVTFLYATWKDALWIEKHKRKDAIIVSIDGVYSTSRFPFESISQNIIRHPFAFITDFSRFIWYKREWIPGSTLGTLSRYLPGWFVRKNEMKYNFRHIHFSFPASKIVKVNPETKTQYFSKQIIDKEVAEKLPETLYNPLRANQYVFDSEEHYYADLQKSKFGITGKRAGWDCLRHYEMAANGVIMCFKNLNLKPATCAPYGLNESNSISYKNFDDLMQKLGSISDEKYISLLEASYQWIQDHTTEKLAARLLVDFTKDIHNLR